MQDAERVALRTKIAWGVGSAAERIALTAVGAFAMFYYNQVLGVPATLAGLAITVSLVLDGLTDPLMGSISDRTRSRWGRRHPYMFVAPLPIALSMVAIFNPPPGIAEIWLFVWFAAFVTTLRLAMTVYHTPHLALGGELSKSYTERSAVMAYNTFFGFTADSVIKWVAFTFFFAATAEYERGLMNPRAYAPFAYTIAGVALSALLASAYFTRDQIPRLPRPPEDLPRFSPKEFVKDIGRAFRNVNYVYLLIAFFFLSCTLGMRDGLLLYVQTFFWDLHSAQIRWFVLGNICGFIFSFLTVARLHGRFDKRRTIVAAGVVMVLSPAILPLLRVLGVIPAGEPWILPALIAMTAVTQGAMTLLGITVMSALADIADENELKFGVRQEGVLYSTRTLFSKIDMAIGSMLVGVSLDLIQFPKSAKPGSVSTGTLDALALVDALVPILPGLVAVYFYSRYRIDRATFETTRRALDSARTEGKAPVRAAGPTTIGG